MNKPVKAFDTATVREVSLSGFLRSLMLSALFLLSLQSVHAQRFGNEWINTNQSYYKIPIGEDGLYRIGYAELQTAGFPVDNVDPRRMQLFFRGQEQAILVQGQNDASFDPADFILFYGQRNDGTQDQALYVAPEAQGNPNYNLYSDTTAYFLTWALGAVNGKRMTFFQENNITNIPAEPYHWQEKLLQLTSDFTIGRQYPIGSPSAVFAHLSDFDYGEGWTGPRIQQGASRNYTLEAPAQYGSGPQPQLEILLTGRNNRRHNVTIQVGGSTLRTLSTVDFEYYDHLLVSENLAWSDLAGGSLTVRVTANGVDGGADNVSVGYIRLKYPQQLSAEGLTAKKLFVAENPSGKSYVEISALPANPYLLDITDSRNVQRIGFNLVSSQATAIIPDTQSGRQLFVGSPRPVSVIRRVSFTSINTAADYLIISHELLRQPAGNYSDPVQAYQEYRSSATGGGFTSLLINMGQLYDQFSYGEITPLAIRRFADYMLSKGDPQYLLLLGKSLTVNFNNHRQNPATATLRDLVPTGGYPGSDVLLTAGLEGSDGYGSAIPTGRINARNPAEVASYLDKVKEIESRGLQPDYQQTNPREALWRKHLVHLSGGISLAELSLFSRYVDDLANTAEADFLGGKVSIQSKKSNNATELINIAEEVNQGLSLITFFGHSSTTRTDIEIGYVSNDQLGYRNKGKYPAILINGCGAGNIFSNAVTFGEDWILTPDRGAMHVIAHAAEGIPSVLKRFSDAFYNTAFNDTLYIGSAMGKIRDEAAKRFVSGIGNNLWEVHIAQVSQSIMQGDPAVTLFGREKPDLEINDNTLSIVALEDRPVNIFSDSFAIKMVVRNFGRNTNDSLRVTVNRTLNNGNTLTYGPRSFPTVTYQDTIQFTLATSDAVVASGEEFGNNRFEVILDAGDSVPEINESNNRAYLENFVPLGGSINLAPQNFAVLSDDSPRLYVQPGDLQATLLESDRRQYLIELDTSHLFDSPLKIQYSLDAGALAMQEVTLAVTQDSTVYYWRSKYAEPREGEIDQWTTSSFTYLSSKESGWGQVDKAQLGENVLDNMLYDDAWSFAPTGVDIEISSPGAAVEGLTATLKINGRDFVIENTQFLSCIANSINAVAFEKNSLFPYLAVKKGGFDEFDGNSCGPLPQVINTYNNNQVIGAGLALENYIERVGDGDPVLIFSRGTMNYQSWPATTFTRLRELGVDESTLSNLPIGSPLIILGRKNAAPGTATVLTADTTAVIPPAEQQLELTERLNSSFRSGNILSRRVGPAAAWSTLYSQIASLEPTDIAQLNVIGETADNKQVLLFSDVLLNEPFDLSTVNAEQYPYLRLNLLLEDAVNLSPAQLESWVVDYQSLPEGILLSENDFEQKEVRQEGESLSYPFRFFNLSGTDFSDSVKVVYNILNQSSRQLISDTIQIEPLAAGDTAGFELSVSTLGRVGENDLQVSVNPRILREQTYNNNQLSIPSFMEVNADELNPVIDVAFDGTYIMDGDIVSPRPVITVEVRDENPFLQKQDTTGIDIFLGREALEATAATNARTTASHMQRISLSSEQVSWSPAEGDEPFKIIFEPGQLEDGLYTLRVQAEDASGNASGTQPYEVNFEIINESSITNFYPYPNPFSTSTRFVFTLTGQEIPDQIKIQIMTVSGKVVREITQDELGPVRIGNNISEYAWDGRDEFGDQLANGVYLYRVVARSNGKSLELRETAGDKGFKNGFGKMYILR
jgi:hypothetical protein